MYKRFILIPSLVFFLSPQNDPNTPARFIRGQYSYPQLETFTDALAPSMRPHIGVDQLLGFEQHVIHDSRCPGNPDAFDYYIIWGYPLGDGVYQTSRSEASGHTSYYCGGETVNGNFSQFPAWQACESVYGPNNCPCAVMTAGGYNCTEFDP